MSELDNAQGQFLIVGSVAKYIIMLSVIWFLSVLSTLAKTLESLSGLAITYKLHRLTHRLICTL